MGVQGSRLLRVEPHPDSPGLFCAIGARSPEIVHDPNRLSTPLRRVGPKGAYAFEPVGWDAAFAEITSRLLQVRAEHGAQAAAIYTGRGSFDMALCDVYQPAGVAVSSACSVLFPFGSPNTLGVGALCYVAFAMIAPHVTFGEFLLGMEADVDRSELVVIWGANPATDSPPLMHHRILSARRRGAEVVAIDPRRHGTAREVDAEWIAIRPGTDGALALGLVEVLIEEELYDERFAREWTVGFGELRQLTQHFRPEVVESMTGVPAESVRRLARRIALARGAAPVMYTGLEYSGNGVQAIRAVLSLFALAGQLDVPGGLVLKMKGSDFPQNRSRLVANPDEGSALGRDRFPIYSRYRGESHAVALPRSVLEGVPYRTRALLVLGGSLLTAWPEPDLWRRTLAGLELLVCIDRYLTADAAYADLVLPATTGYENLSYVRAGPVFRLRERILPPVGEARPDTLILAELARRLGYGHLYPQTEEALVRHALEGSGFTLEQVRKAGGSVRLTSPMMQYRKWEKGLLRADGALGFETPSGKLELASSILAEHGYDPLPTYAEPPESPRSRPDLAKRFPLVLGSGSRTPYDFRSQHHGVRGLVERHPEPLAVMHPHDAAPRGIADGDPVWVATARGEAPFRARITEEIAPGTVDACMGGGGPVGPDAWRACNVNVLTDLGQVDPISGFPAFKALLCDVRRADGARRESEVEPCPASPRVELSPPPRSIYLDHNATTPLAPEVLEAMLPFLREEYGNPSSIHGPGTRARSAVEAARRSVAVALACTARRVVFTGSGTESDNLAVRGAAWRRRDRGKHVVTSAIEHPAVLEACAALEELGFEVTRLPVDRSGHVRPQSLEEALRPDTVLVSIMLASNELGTLQPIADLARIAHAGGALFHTDAVQALGKVSVDPARLGIDLLSVSAHKIHGPKGVGALFVREGVALSPLVRGGGQERGIRSGTENVAGIIGFAKACELARQRLESRQPERLRPLVARLLEGLGQLVPGARRNGEGPDTLPGTLSVTLPGIRGESLVLDLARRAVHFSSGSACQSGHPEPSHVLLALGLRPEEAHCSVRFSLGPDNDERDIDEALARIAAALREARDTVRFVACR
jgi:cysteine desulfurase NifS